MSNIFVKSQVKRRRMIPSQSIVIRDPITLSLYPIVSFFFVFFFISHILVKSQVKRGRPRCYLDRLAARMRAPKGQFSWHSKLTTPPPLGLLSFLDLKEFRFQSREIIVKLTFGVMRPRRLHSHSLHCFCS